MKRLAAHSLLPSWREPTRKSRRLALQDNYQHHCFCAKPFTVYTILFCGLLYIYLVPCSLEQQSFPFLAPATCRLANCDQQHAALQQPLPASSKGGRCALLASFVDASRASSDRTAGQTLSPAPHKAIASAFFCPSTHELLAQVAPIARGCDFGRPLVTEQTQRVGRQNYTSLVGAWRPATVLSCWMPLGLTMHLFVALMQTSPISTRAVGAKL